jgi:hypothetical protein
MMSEQIFIQVGSERVELTGEALEDFLADRAQTQAEQVAFQVEQDAKAAAKESAKAKLAALGLTEVEILALVGE